MRRCLTVLHAWWYCACISTIPPLFQSLYDFIGSQPRTAPTSPAIDNAQVTSEYLYIRQISQFRPSTSCLLTDIFLEGWVTVLQSPPLLLRFLFLEAPKLVSVKCEKTTVFIELLYNFYDT